MSNAPKPGSAKLRRIHVEGVASYPSLLKPTLNKLSNKMEYRVTLILKKDNPALAAIRELIRDVGTEGWGPDQSKWPRTRDEDGNLVPPRIPLRSVEVKRDTQTGKLPEGMEDGGFFIDLKSNRPPGIVKTEVIDGKPANVRVTDEADIYGGCVLKVSVNAYKYGGPPTKFRAGISLGLGNVQKVRDGTPLGGGRIAPEDEFAPGDADPNTGESQGGAAAGVSADQLI